jgi:retron-type reverse transcriptase
MEVLRRTGDLWHRVVSFENLYRASYQALRGKRSRAYAGDFFCELEGNLIALRRELCSGKYRPGEYHTFWIIEPKARMISAAPFRDRVVHHALVNVIEPAFEERFIHHSYACRKGKGTHRALRQFIEWGRSTRHVLKMDIRKFFPSMDHEILKETIRRTIRSGLSSTSPAMTFSHRLPAAGEYPSAT